MSPPRDEASEVERAYGLLARLLTVAAVFETQMTADARDEFRTITDAVRRYHEGEQ